MHGHGQAYLAELDAKLAIQDAENRQCGEDRASMLASLDAEKCRLKDEWEAARLKSEGTHRLRTAFEQEKEAMAKLGIGNNDLIGLNFGGEQVVAFKRSLLLQLEGSMFASMFSGRHEEQLNRDERGKPGPGTAVSIHSASILALLFPAAPEM